MEGVSAYPDGGAGLNGDVHQSLEETVEPETLVPRERAQQLTAEQVGDAPQFREETHDEELPVPCERVQQLTAELIGNVPRDDVKNSATAAGTTVAKPVGCGEARHPSGEDGSFWPGADDTTRHVDATVAKAVGEARPLGIAEHSVTTALVPRERVQQRLSSKLRMCPNFLKKPSRR